MPKSKSIIEIKTWSDYLGHYCEGITEDKAQEYAEKGKQFLNTISAEKINTKDLPGKNQSENMAYLHWYLLKTSFDEGKCFSKGTFNLRLDDDQKTQTLYEYLKGDAHNLYKNKLIGTITEFFKGLFQFNFDKYQPYSRTSTHYNKQLHKREDGHFGVDNNKKEVPLAWHFKTHAFALTNPQKGEPLSLYIKPETEGANLKNTWETIKHLVNLIKAKISPEKIVGMSESFRESTVDTKVKQEAIRLFSTENSSVRLQKKFKNELKSYKSIPEIRNLLVRKCGEGPVVSKFDEYIESTYGTKNQTGCEIRFAYQNSILQSELNLKQEGKKKLPQENKVELSQEIKNEAALKDNKMELAKENALDVKTYSKKGFVAIDLDGTALVQKFDKNKWHGLRNKRSDLRKQLINHMKTAQDQGYDIVIMTARPEFVEKFILEPGRNRLGTKPTQDIVDQLKEQGINIKEIIRAQPKGLKEGLKGEPMVETLKRYQNNNAPDAIGILFDDQLKQIKDVKNKQDQNLIAYDINSPKDSAKFMEKMRTKNGNNLDENNSQLTNETYDKLNNLSTELNKINNDNYQQDKKVLKKVLKDLAARQKEAFECKYTPEIDWVNKAIRNLEFLITKLSSQDPITHKNISQISKKIFGQSNPSTFIPNTKCERTIRSCLLYLERLPILADIKQECGIYREHLKKVVKRSKSEDESSAKAKNKLEIVDDLLQKLNNPNSTKALEQFNQAFKEKEEILKTSRTGSEFVKKICSFLSKIPFLRQLFKTEGEKLSDRINSNSQNYCKTKHYERVLDVIQLKEQKSEVEVSPLEVQTDMKETSPPYCSFFKAKPTSVHLTAPHSLSKSQS